MRFLLPIVIALIATSALAAAPDEHCSARADVDGLPLIELPSQKSGDTLAIMITGDGGWRRIDAKVTDPLRAAGISVVGFRSPDYFHERRTAEESSCALERVIRTYQLRWRRPNVVLIGYSRGADVLPFMASHLPSDLKSSIKLTALLGLEPTIDFRYHPSWIPFYHPREKQYPVAPEVAKLTGPLLCVYGAKEKDSFCPALDPSRVKIVRMPGGHHFDGKYDEVAAAILGMLR